MLWEGFNKRSERILIMIALGLLIPAFFIGLGKPLLVEDECIRALVALEMQYQDDYLTPTIGGDMYFKKPPLYNWILAGFTQMAGDYSALTLRIPNVIFLFLFAGSIWFFVRKALGNRIALLSAFAFLTAGRIVFYESFLALIDILFSWIVFLEFMVIYFYQKKKKYLQLFLLTYLLTAIAFMLKTLPALVFTAFSLLLIFIWKKDWKRLFGWQHILGIVMFFSLIGVYYYLYFHHNHFDPLEFLTVMFTESSRRTATGGGVLRVIKHIFVYPFEIIGHFAPWTLFIVLLYKRQARSAIRSNDFVWVLLLLFGVNIILYWISPEVHPRYILMLIPLLYIILIYAAEKAWGWKNKGVLMLSFVILMLCTRIVEDIFVFPIRATEELPLLRKEYAIKMAEQTGDEKVYSYWPPSYTIYGYYGRRIAPYDFMYYFTVEKGQVFEITKEFKPGELYIMRNNHFNDSLFIKLDTFDFLPNYSYHHILVRAKEKEQVNIP